MTNSTDQDQAPTYRDDVYRGMHYENTPIQIYRTFHLEKKWKFSYKKLRFFNISAQNIDCGYSLEPPRRGGSNEFHNLCFEQK